MTRESFIFYRSFFENIKELPVKEKAKTYDAIALYALDGEIVEDLTGIAKVIYTMALPVLSANNKRFTDGKKGGRPKDDESPRKEIDGINLTNLTEVQYNKLVSRFGEDVTNKSIELFENFLEKDSPVARGYLNKNHYAHFKVDNWTIKNAQQYIKEQQKQNQPNWSI